MISFVLVQNYYALGHLNSCLPKIQIPCHFLRPASLLLTHADHQCEKISISDVTLHRALRHPTGLIYQV